MQGMQFDQIGRIRRLLSGTLRMMDYQKFDRLKEKLDSYRPLATEIGQTLHEDLVLRWIYNSNAIEGNTLNLKETKVALEGITIGGKTLREHLEAINHRDAINYEMNQFYRYAVIP